MALSVRRIFPIWGGKFQGGKKFAENSFLGRYSLNRNRVHGGFFCYFLKGPVVEDVFVVGCAQGQALPLTGEGIRRCVKCGLRCGEISLKEERDEYIRFALEAKRKYYFLLSLQNRLLGMSKRSIGIWTSVVSNRLLFGFLERRYRKI